MPDRHETGPEFTRRIADDGTGNLRSEAAIEQALRDEMGIFAQVDGDLGNFPSDANIRPKGFFTDPEDLREYLELGGLVATQGGDYIPVTWIWLHEVYDDTLEEWTYQVYIQEDTN